MSNGTEIKKTALDQEMKLATMMVLWRLPNFVTSLLAAVASSSMVVWMEFIENASILIPGVLLAIISKRINKNLKFRFNYGTGKVEAIAAFTCEIFDIAGLTCIIFFAIRRIIKGESHVQFLIFAIALQVIGLMIDLYLLDKQKKLSEHIHSKMFHTAYVSAQKELCFDVISVITLVVSYIFKDAEWIKYFSPVVCLIMVVPFVFIVSKHLLHSIMELIDITLDEDTQMRLLKVMSEYYDDYDELYEIKSRQSGDKMYVDIELSFPEDRNYSEIRESADRIKERIQKELDHSIVNIVLK